MDRVHGHWRAVITGLALLAALAVSLWWATPASAAGRRVALVVGNAEYAAAGALTNPRKDAALVSEALRRAGFETVETKTNLGVGPFRDALRQFQVKADGAEVALVYYAGHGIEAKGVNWLIPIDAALSDDRALPYEAISLELVLEAVGGAQVRVVMLDACRDNPFGRTWTSGTRSVARGLARTEADDVLVVFAAAPGQQASDGAGGNSPFAVAVAQRLPQSGAPIQLLGGLIRDDVMAATGNQQRPFVSASVSGTPFYLVPDTGAAKAAVAAPPAAPGPGAEVAMWQSAERIDSAAAYQAYLAQYPAGAYAGLARAAMAKLEAAPARLATTLPVSQPSPAAPPSAPPPSEAMTRGRALMLKGDYAGAEPAFQAVLAVTPPSPEAGEARFWLARGQSRRMQHDKAVETYLAALAGWPQTSWAPEAVVELGRELVALGRRPDACLALRQLSLHYPGAPRPLLNRANQVRKGAGCMGGGDAAMFAGAPPPGGGQPGATSPARRPGAPAPRRPKP